MSAPINNVMMDSFTSQQAGLSNLEMAKLDNHDMQLNEVSSSNNFIDKIINSAMNYVDNIEHNRNIVNFARKNPNQIDSARKLLEVSEALQSFTIGTQILAKSTSTVIKGIDSLVHIQ